MGKLSDWFGAGAARDRAQDTRINELAAKVSALEAAPGSSVGITALTTQVNNIAAQIGGINGSALDAKVTDLAAKVASSNAQMTAMVTKVAATDTKVAGIDTKVTNLAAKEVVDATARSALAANATAFQNINQRLAVIEADFAALPADPSGGITVPEINP